MALPDRTLCWVEGPPWDRVCTPIDADVLIDVLRHPERYLSAEEIARYEECQRSIVEAAIWIRP
jgi:hypothetical protein